MVRRAENRSRHEGRREGGQEAGGQAQSSGTIRLVKRVGRLEKISHGTEGTWHVSCTLYTDDLYKTRAQRNSHATYVQKCSDPGHGEAERI